MAVIAVSLPSDGTTADVSDYNTPITTIVNEFNGNIDNANIKSAAAIDGSKLADASITNAKYADDSITDSELDYPRFWQEIARTTLSGAADTISVTSIPTRKYLKVLVYATDTGGTIDFYMRFNNDTAGNYARRISDNGGADSAAGVSQTGLALDTAAVASPQFAVVDIINVLAVEKMVQSHWTSRGTAGAAAVGTRRELVGKWANTAAAISRIDIVNIGGTGDYAIGSEVVVLGHD